MRFDGAWRICDDGEIRPILKAEILDSDGVWQRLELLIDTGADRTVVCASVWSTLGLEPTRRGTEIAGVGGTVSSLRFRTRLGIHTDDGTFVTLRGEFTACLNSEVLDMSILGRDIIDLFTLVADRRGNVLALLGGNHSYSIQPN